MAHRVCPWWLGYLLASPIRGWMGQDATEILRPYVREGMGFFTIPLARWVGDAGRVIAVDVEPKMIAGLQRRAIKAKIGNRIDARVTSAETLRLEDVAEKVDLTLAFAVVHEFPDAQHFFDEIAHASKHGSKVLLAEPRGHVNDSEFAAELSAAAASGFTVST